MLEKSSDSVNIHYLNIDTVLGELQQAAHALKAAAKPSAVLAAATAVQEPAASIPRAGVEQAETATDGAASAAAASDGEAAARLAKSVLRRMLGRAARGSTATLRPAELEPVG